MRESTVAKLRNQIRAVEAVIKISDGSLRDAQQCALAGLQEALQKAQQDARDARPVTQRRTALQKVLEETEFKLQRNKDLLEAARAEVVKLEGFCLSQETKVCTVKAELAQLAAEEAKQLRAEVEPMHPSVAAIQSQIAALQQQLQ